MTLRSESSLTLLFHQAIAFRAWMY